MPRILGIDSSLTGTGLCRLDITSYDADGYVPEIALATVRVSKSQKGDTWRAKSRRVHEVLAQIESAICDGDELIQDRVVMPDLVVLEELAYGAKGTALVVLHWLWGEVVTLCCRYDVPLLLVNVSGIKKFATGKGNAPKEEVLLAMVNRYPDAGIEDNNQADAYAAAMMGARWLEHPVDRMPALHLEAMDKVALQ